MRGHVQRIWREVTGQPPDVELAGSENEWRFFETLLCAHVSQPLVDFQADFLEELIDSEPDMLEAVRLTLDNTPEAVMEDATGEEHQESMAVAALNLLKPLLTEIEWTGYRLGQGRYMGDDSIAGHQRYDACPYCGGLRERNVEFISSAVGHRPRCRLYTALHLVEAGLSPDATTTAPSEPTTEDQ